MKVMLCGHRELHDRTAVEKWLLETCAGLIDQGADTFYLGGYGAFDALGADMLRRLKGQYSHIRVCLIVPYPDIKKITDKYDELIYPPLEHVPRRYAIVKRNEWMVRESDTVVAYVLYSWGGAASTLRYAQKHRKQIIGFKRLADA